MGFCPVSNLRFFSRSMWRVSMWRIIASEMWPVGWPPRSWVIFNAISRFNGHGIAILDGLDGWHNPTSFKLQSKQCQSCVWRCMKVFGFLVSKCPNFGSIDRTLIQDGFLQFGNHPQMWQQRVQVTNATTSTTVWDHSMLLSVYLVFTSRQCCTWISSDLDYVVFQESMGCNINQLLWVAQQCIVSQWAER